MDVVLSSNRFFFLFFFLQLCSYILDAFQHIGDEKHRQTNMNNVKN